MTRKIAILATNFGPYHFARLHGFKERVKSLSWQVTGIELSRTERTYSWRTNTSEVDHEFRTIIHGKTWEDVSLLTLTKSLFNCFSGCEIDVLVIPGYHTPIFLFAMIWARVQKKPVILMLASKENDRKRHPWIEYCKSLIIKNYQAALVGGSPQKRYLEKLGMPSDRIFIGYDVVDNESFVKSKIQHLENPIKNPFFLTINRFIEKKNLFWLLSVYSEYRNQLGEKAWDLVLCGDGDLRIEILTRIAELNLEEFVHTPGFLQRNDQLPFFAHAGCFIHASTQEQWGLVINEGMASSLPVLVSNRCGCVEDLVIEGKNGFTFDPENKAQLIRLMIDVSIDTYNLKEMGNNARIHIEKFSPTFFAENLLYAIEEAYK